VIFLYEFFGYYYHSPHSRFLFVELSFESQVYGLRKRKGIIGNKKKEEENENWSGTWVNESSSLYDGQLCYREIYVI